MGQKKTDVHLRKEFGSRRNGGVSVVKQVDKPPFKSLNGFACYETQIHFPHKQGGRHN